MAASDCKMVEVGTTNRTKPTDYSNSITPKTAILFKAHKSNYIIKGFTKEVGLEELVQIGHEFKIPVLYDLGSGLLRKINNPSFIDEPTVRQSLERGASLVCFSGDKLLGGPQAGIIVGKKELIAKLKQEPMMRALRVCKTTLVLLEAACSYYLNDTTLNEKNMIFRTFSRTLSELRSVAELLKINLHKNGIVTEIVPSRGQCGGGTLPDGEIDSFAVALKCEGNNKTRSEFAEKLHAALLLHDKPVLGVLKQGNIIFDVLTVFENEVEEIAKVISEVFEKLKE
jgi:L-seryl-tRNA(Ser) seleniumtransferase